MIALIIDSVLIFLGIISSFYLFYKKTFLTKKSIKLKKIPKISIIIPCRNEENQIGLLLNDLQNQTLKPFEIIVVNDQSTDSTAEVINNFDVTLIDVDEKPNEYIGKSWAIELGSMKSSGDLLLFLDADVRLLPDALDLLLNTYLNQSNDVLSVQPYHLTHKLYEQLSIPFNLIQLAANEVTTYKGKAFALYGPLILIPKKIYEDIGRHYHVRNKVIEDVELGILLNKNGYTFKSYLGKYSIRFRMYPNGIKSLIEGWTKNIAAGATKTNPLVIFMIFSFVASSLGSFTRLVISSVQGNILLICIFLGLYIFWIIRLYLISINIGKFKKISFIFYPLILISFIFIFLLSAFKKIFKIPIKWKNRKIK